MQPLIYLASRSPRRRELLTQIGVHHTVVDIEVDETPLANEAPAEYVIRMALEKARAGQAAIAGNHPLPVLAADTAVVVGQRILGKPRDQADAIGMLQQLSDTRHKVLTGVALTAGREATRLSVSQVRFRPISPAEALAYWQSGEPADKAGGYAIQGRGALFVSALEGSFSGVMGLPLFETGELLRQAGIDPLQLTREATHE